MFFSALNSDAWTNVSDALDLDNTAAHAFTVQNSHHGHPISSPAEQQAIACLLLVDVPTGDEHAPAPVRGQDKDQLRASRVLVPQAWTADIAIPAGKELFAVAPAAKTSISLWPTG